MLMLDKDLPESYWRNLAQAVSNPYVTDWLIQCALKTPYTHITGRNNPEDIYMERYWLFNPYSRNAQGILQPPAHQQYPSIRLHHIVRPDDDEHEHDHPWDARSLILKGWYTQERKTITPNPELIIAGTCNSIQKGEFHRITEVSRGGVWTMFITWEPGEEDWGFLIDGKKIQHDEYLKGVHHAG